jgi:hypothetical protein
MKMMEARAMKVRTYWFMHDTIVIPFINFSMDFTRVIPNLQYLEAKTAYRTLTLPKVVLVC